MARDPGVCALGLSLPPCAYLAIQGDTSLSPTPTAPAQTEVPVLLQLLPGTVCVLLWMLSLPIKLRLEEDNPATLALALGVGLNM